MGPASTVRVVADSHALVWYVCGDQTGRLSLAKHGRYGYPHCGRAGVSLAAIYQASLNRGYQ